MFSGNSFIQMKQYSEAIVSFEHIMKTKPSYRTAFNLILCYYGIGVAEKMKKSFVVRRFMILKNWVFK